MSANADPTRAVACPTCHAKPGSPCKRPSGHTVFGGGSHAARVRLVQNPAHEAPIVVDGKPRQLWAQPADPQPAADQLGLFEEPTQ